MEKQETYNPFDELFSYDPEEAEKFAKDQKAKGEKFDYLVHRVFAQSDEGQELLALWKESLSMAPTAEEGMDTLSIGIREGMKRFIRNIIITVKKVEET